MNHEQPPASGEQPPEPATSQSPQAAPGSPVEPQLAEPELHEQGRTPPPRIWVSSLADYNNGSLHGAWIEAAREPEEIQADIDAMLAASPWTAQTGEPAEEWAIHDRDGFGALRIGEHENLRWISTVGKGIAQHGLAFAAYAEVVEDEELLGSFDKEYLGHYDSLHTYLEQTINDLGYDRILDEVVPPKLRPYVKIDIDATARDLQFGGDLHVLAATEGGVWIFRG
jgi:antirestriction protein